ncbi:MAG: hypothetical protein QM645_07745 [Asticcacaulis sp.]
MFDKRARDILFNRYWGPQGWAGPNKQIPSPEDFAYAKSKGYMFDPVVLSHDEMVKHAIAMRDAIKLSAVADAFVGSLSRRTLAQRSALGSYVHALHLLDHTCQYSQILETGHKWCEYCGAYELIPAQLTDLNILNFYRHKWGGVMHSDILYIGFDLEWFKHMEITPPDDEDFAVLRKILNIASNQPLKATPNHLDKALSKALPSSSNERRKMIEILGACGVLKSEKQDDFFDVFIPEIYRDRPGSRSRSDWTYPVCWWSGSDGVNTDRVQLLFPNL